MFLPPQKLGMIIDFEPSTFTESFGDALRAYGSDMWCFLQRTDGYPTLRGLNTYEGESRRYGQYIKGR